MEPIKQAIEPAHPIAAPSGVLVGADDRRNHTLSIPNPPAPDIPGIGEAPHWHARPAALSWLRRTRRFSIKRGHHG
ncbi:MAG: hypothetical protein DCC66_00620 [Planctomycetota bacterium]|nr:MAG: hypothetical protein DCC66_00620 [Planctomycetota bacterium]